MNLHPQRVLNQQQLGHQPPAVGAQILAAILPRGRSLRGGLEENGASPAHAQLLCVPASCSDANDCSGDRPPTATASAPNKSDPLDMLCWPRVRALQSQIVVVLVVGRKTGK